jgi:hypothetical protein
VAQGVEARAGWDRPQWLRHENVRWQAQGLGERSWGENENCAKEIKFRFLNVMYTCMNSILRDSQALMVDVDD